MGEVGDSFLQANILLHGLPVRHGLGDKVSDLIGIERLVDIVVRAIFQRCDGRFDRGVTGHDNDQHVGTDFVQAALQLDAVGATHLDIDESNVESLLSHTCESVTGALGSSHVITLFGEPFGQ